MAQIGLVGVGVMGAAFALNLVENGHRVSLYNRTADKVADVAAKAKQQKLPGEVIACASLEEFVASMSAPRSVLVLVPAGRALDAVIDGLTPLLDKGDLIADLGNSNFRDTEARVAALEAQGLQFLGIGISGGEEGARVGPSIMAGGSKSSWAQVQGPLSDAAADFEGTPCCDWFGPGGAGHFVKTLHNGIEYADMQLIAEVYGIMRDGLGMTAAEIAPVFERWNQGALGSYLIEIAAEVAAAVDPVSGAAMLDVIVDAAGQKGTGRWSVVEALHLGAPVGMIAAAVEARNISADRPTRFRMDAEFGSAPTPLAGSGDDRASVIETLEAALIAAKIIAYIQGLEVLERASVEFDWHLDLGAVARVWRAGCIIRSVFLDEISAVMDQGGAANLALEGGFSQRLIDNIPSLRTLVATSVTAGLPCSALFLALNFHDQRRTSRGTANMIQGLRDFFGAHGFERLDDLGVETHGPWAMK